MFAEIETVWLVAPVVTLLACLFADRLAARTGLVDHPDGQRKLHRAPTPLVGGLAVVAPLFAVSLIVWLSQGLSTALFSMMAATAAFAAIGMADDRFGTSATSRLIAGLCVTIVAVGVQPMLRLQELHLPIVELPLELGLLAGLGLTTLTVAGFVNAVNMADGANGLVPGLWTIWIAGALSYAPAEAVPLLTVLLIAVATVAAFNWRGRLFLGDAGSYAAGATAGFVAIWLYNHPGVADFHAGVAIAWFLVPVLDCLRMVSVRLQRGQSPFKPCRGHLHHRLQDRFGTTGGVLAYYAVVGVPVTLTSLGGLSGSGAVVAAVSLYAAALVTTSRRFAQMTRAGGRRDAGATGHGHPGARTLAWDRR